MFKTVISSVKTVISSVVEKSILHFSIEFIFYKYEFRELG